MSTALYSYLFVYNDDLGSADDLKAYADIRPEIVNWKRRFAKLPNSMLLVSPEDAGTLSNIIRERFPDGSFIIVQVNDVDKNGWLPKSMWDLINNPRPA
jgi:hypothetical protein